MTDFGTEDVGNEVGPFAYTRNLLGELSGNPFLADDIAAALEELDAVEATLPGLRDLLVWAELYFLSTDNPANGALLDSLNAVFTYRGGQT